MMNHRSLGLSILSAPCVHRSSRRCRCCEPGQTERTMLGAKSERIAIAQYGRNSIAALVQQLGHLVGVIIECPVITCGQSAHDILTDGLPVNVGVAGSHSAHI